MRHLKSGRKLNRNSAHRDALFRNLAKALIINGLIKTTVPKAKELRSFVEKLITKAKQDTVANRRLVFSKLRDKFVVGKLFNEIAPVCRERQGGYTRVIKCGFRNGDAAPMAYIELVDRKKQAEATADTAAKSK